MFRFCFYLFGGQENLRLVVPGGIFCFYYELCIISKCRVFHSVSYNVKPMLGFVRCENARLILPLAQVS